MNINIDDLKKIIDRIFVHLIEAEVVEFELKENYYWDIPFPDVYDLDKNPEVSDVGSLTEEWEFLAPLLDEEEQPLVYQLVELSSIIRYLGETVGRELASKGG